MKLHAILLAAVVGMTGAESRAADLAIERAGLAVDDILAMLTTAPAQLFSVARHQGRVAPGMDGDLTILGSDPKSAGVGAFSDVRYTIRAGQVLFDGAPPKSAQDD